MALTSRGYSGPQLGSLRALAFALGLLALMAVRPLSAADVTVIMDQARLLRLPDRVATIVIGNPMIGMPHCSPAECWCLPAKATA